MSKWSAVHAAAALAMATALAVSPALLGAVPVNAAALPITDPSAIGAIGLCDQHLQPVTHGSLGQAPFVWRAVGATAAPGPWAKAGRTATLYAFQPRPSVPAGQWSGIQLTASGRYSNAAHPMAQATRADTSLADFVAQYPPQVDGLIQLRLYLGGPQLPLYLQHYDATVIKVSRTGWSVVDGGAVSCTTGASVSAETLLLPSSVVNPHPGASGARTGTGTAGPTSAGATSPAPTAGSGAHGTGTGAVPTGRAEAAGTHTTAAGSDGHAALAWTGLCLLVLLIGLGAWFAYRRRQTD